jgi:hypothetical protein
VRFPTNEELIDLFIAESRDVRVKEDNTLTDAEVKAEMMTGLEEEPAAQVVMQRLAKAIFTMGYNAAVAGPSRKTACSRWCSATTLPST